MYPGEAPIVEETFEVQVTGVQRQFDAFPSPPNRHCRGYWPGMFANQTLLKMNCGASCLGRATNKPDTGSMEPVSGVFALDREGGHWTVGAELPAGRFERRSGLWDSVCLVAAVSDGLIAGYLRSLVLSYRYNRGLLSGSTPP